MEVASVLQVYHAADVKGNVGSAPGLTTKRLVGNNDRPSERISVTLATLQPGTCSHFHWHLVERCYFVVSGHGVVRDIEGKSYDLEPGSTVYAPPGINGSHEFDAKDQMQLIAVSATADPEKALEFTVDKVSKNSTIAVDQIVKRLAGIEFRSLY